MIITMMKEKTEKNSADLMTKYFTNDRTAYLMSLLHLEPRDGVHPEALKVEVDLEQLSANSALLETNLILGSAVESDDKDLMHDDVDNNQMDDLAALIEIMELQS